MNKSVFLIILIIMITSIIFAYRIEPLRLTPPTPTEIYFTHPERFSLLPNNLAPYCCGEVVQDKCIGKVDLETASFLVKQGMNPATNYYPPKESLRCN
jgi:hypothetical protein